MNDHIFIYWDDLGDSQEHVDKQIKKPNGFAAHSREIDWKEEEEILNKRMDIIGSNGNTGEHYPEFDDYLDITEEE
jgi:hypothetical protein